MKRSMTFKRLSSSRKENHSFRMLKTTSLALILLMGLALGLSSNYSRTKAGDGRLSPRERADKAAWGERVTVFSAAQGRPWVNMMNGRELIADYLDRAESVRAMSAGETRALSLASGDFDKNGVPDLVCGYKEQAGGSVMILRGNIDSIYPTTPEARERKRQGTFTDAPFVSPGKVFDIAEAPDLIQAGDFNADGNSDVAAAARGGNTIHLLQGDGGGGFRESEAIVLPGLIDAMAAGEMDRADGLIDLVVSLSAQGRNELLVFEGPEGALKSKPDTFALAAPAPALAIGYIDGDHFGDVAAATGNELTMLHGRDRKLLVPETERGDVSAAKVSSRAFPQALKSLAVGDFTGDLRLELAVMLDDGSVQSLTHKSGARATRNDDPWEVKTMGAGGEMKDATLLCARVSSLTHETLVMIDRAGRQLGVLMDEDERLQRGDTTVAAGQNPPALMKVEGAPVAVLPMRLNEDGLSDLVVLREGSYSPSVLLTAAAATFCVQTTNDCTGCGSLRDAIANANGNPGLDNIFFSTPFNGVQTIRVSASLGPFPSINEAVTIIGSADCGTINGPQFEPQAPTKVRLDGQNAVARAFNLPSGGTVIRSFVLSRFTTGIQVPSGGRNNFIEDNFIGTDASGNTSVNNGNTRGVLIDSAAANVIGGNVSPATNVIGGNLLGIEISGGSSLDNVVRRNLIGVSTSFTLLGNIQSGLMISNNASRNIIGGPLTSGQLLNTIADNLDGVVIQSGSNNNVQSNQIDLNRRNGVTINSGGNLIGGPSAAANGIWRSKNNGVEINGPLAGDNLVQGNAIGIAFIGEDILDFGNEKDGVVITGNAVANFVGGTANGAGNLIALNRGNGVTVLSGNRHRIIANRITANGLLPIDLGGDGRTNNDDRDGDTGANDLQNFPVLTSATFSATSVGDDITAAAPGLTVTVNFNSTPSQNFDLDFYFGGDCECRGIQCLGTIPLYLGRRSVTTDGSGNFTGSFTFDFTPPPTGGFVNTSATSTTGSTSELSQCIAVGTQLPSCSPVCPTVPAVQAASAAGAAVNFTQPTLPTGCAGVTVTCDRTSGSVFPVGVTAVTCTAREGTTVRGTCSFNVTVTSPPAPTGPTITSAVRNGKKLIVTGTGFIEGAEMFLNDAKQKKVTVNSPTEVVSKKAGKNVVAGQNKVTIRNPDGGTSNDFFFEFQP